MLKVKPTITKLTRKTNSNSEDTITEIKTILWFLIEAAEATAGCLFLLVFLVFKLVLREEMKTLLLLLLSFLVSVSSDESPAAFSSSSLLKSFFVSPILNSFIDDAKSPYFGMNFSTVKNLVLICSDSLFTVISFIC